MSFHSPLYLLLLLLLAPLAWLGMPRKIGKIVPDRTRRWVSLLLRTILLSLLILALAGLELVQVSQRVAVVFLVDVSDSMPTSAREQSFQWVADALAGMSPDDKAAVVLFGADAMIERSMQSGKLLATFSSVPSRLATDLAQAIRLGMALFPNGYARRMVLLSDGVDTAGDTEQAMRLASTNNIPIEVVPFDFKRTNETFLVHAQAPAHLREGQEFDLSVSIQSPQSQRVPLRVLADNVVLWEETVQLNTGSNGLVIPLTATSTGFTRYQVQIDPNNDGFYQNNRLAAYAQVQGPPQVLVVSTPAEDVPDPQRYLVEALQANGQHTTVISPAQLPADLPSLAEYASIVLVDVPARQLSPRQQAALQVYVRDLGGGLLVVGGPQSYAVGGYFRTPLEETLPVEMQIKDEERRPRLTMVFIIDHSGSMEDASGGVSKLELAKEATARSIELLSPGDRVGVIIFDDTAQWVVPLTELQDPAEIVAQVGTIRSGGGTDIMAGLQAMAKTLPADDGAIKHVILLTDGGADSTGIPELITQLNQENSITLSTVGVGTDAAPFLPQLAELGQGRYYHATDPASIPEIFSEETTLATRAYIVEETFFPQKVSDSPILQDITHTPQLYGYVGAELKPTATLILQSETSDGYHDPILASWRYGIGRAVAWTSDATGRWGRDFVAWEQFSQLWAQAVNYTIGEPINLDYSAQVELQNGLALLKIDAIDNTGALLNGLDLSANVIAPDGRSTTLQLEQTAPGEYRAQFTPRDEGAYLVRVGSSGQDSGQTLGWVLSYSPEYRILQADPLMMARIAESTGGRVLSDQPTQAFQHNLPVPNQTQPIWQWLLLAAVLLLPIDIAVRRLVITRYEWQQWIQKVLPQRTTASTTLPQERADSLSRLQAAKQRATVEIPSTPDDAPSVSTPPSAPVPPGVHSANVTPTPPNTAKESQSSLAASLLARKRQKDDEKR
ncbi:MAG TPA: VWA domain-containing protein [Anaerolineales bacterium]|nr:VWA domain-containing protein [Anaerolineales bacterium]